MVVSRCKRGVGKLFNYYYSMAERYPNASILLLLTLVEPKRAGERVLFLHSKIIPDFREEEKLCMPVKSRKIWEEGGRLLRERYFVARTESIHNIFEECLSGKALDIPGSEKTVKLILPKRINRMESVIDDDDIENDHVITCYKPEGESWISEYFMNDEFIDAISGYVANERTAPLMPAGIYEKRWLQKYLGNGIFAVKEERIPYIIFHGTQASAVNGDGCRELVGFAQYPDRGCGDCCMLSDIKNDDEAVSAEIDVQTGLFRLQSDRPVKNGKIRTVIAGKSNPCSTFALLLGVDVNVDVSCRGINIYGEDIFIPDIKAKRPESFVDTTWYELSYHDKMMAEKQLSQKMAEVLSTLGADIVIADPYFIGDMDLSDGGQLTPAMTQRAFVNALVRVSCLYGLDSVTIVGNSRMKNHSESGDGTDDAMSKLRQKYSMYWRSFFEQSAFKYIRPWKMIFRRAKCDFHNRYWLAAEPENRLGNRGVVVSNSISGMVEVDFCNILSSKHFNSVIARYGDIVEKSEILVEI